jgi:hypothetical protein
MKSGNPRFCGTELKPIFNSGRGAFEGCVHGADIRVWNTNRGWLSSAYFSFYGVQLATSLHSTSEVSSLLSLRGMIRNFQRSLMPFEPKPRKKGGKRG